MLQKNDNIDNLIQYIRNRIDPDVNDQDLDFEKELDIQTIDEINKLAKLVQKKYIPVKKLEERFEVFIKLLLDYARHDYSKQAELMNDDYTIFDALAVSINLLGEELNYSTVTKNYLEDIFNSIEDILVVMDNNGIIVSANKAAKEIIKIDDSDINKRYINEFIAGDIKFKKLTSFEKKENHVIISKDKKEYRVSLSVSPFVRGDGQVIGTVIIARDISKILDYQDKIENINIKLKETNAKLLKLMEKAQESDRLKTAFLSNLSHEIRTPLNSICGFSQLLLDRNIAGEEQERYIEFIINSGKRLTRIIDDIIDISKIEANQLKVINNYFNINELMHEVFIEFQRKIDSKKQNVQLIKGKFPDLMCPYLYSDKTRIFQILGNLIDNALKHTLEGFVEYGFSVRNDNFLEFYVKDTGHGIEEKDFDLIFERFRQVNTGPSRLYDGNGLGLSICKGLLEALGGDIWLESKVGKGSTFYFTIPCDSSLMPVENYKNADVDIEINWHGKKILIVENHRESLLLLKHCLSFPGLQILNTRNGIDAIQILKKNNDINLVLLNMSLPEMAGCKVAEIIKNLYPEIPVFAQSANTMQIEREKAQEAGCVEFFIKPVNIETLIIAMNRYLMS